MKKTTVYLPTELRTALRRAALRRGVSEADVILDAIRMAIGDEHTIPRGGLFSSGAPIAREADELLRAFGQR